MFDPYWKIGDKCGDPNNIGTLRSKTVIYYSKTLYEKAQQQKLNAVSSEEVAVDTEVQKDVTDYLSSSDARPLTDKMHGLARTLGPIALEIVRDVLEDAFISLFNGLVPIPIRKDALQVAPQIHEVLYSTARDGALPPSFISNPN